MPEDEVRTRTDLDSNSNAVPIPDLCVAVPGSLSRLVQPPEIAIDV